MSKLKKEEIEITAFKIKLTNLKKKNFPDELKETDYLQYKVGDILRKGASSTVYKVIGLYRGSLRQAMYDHYFQHGMAKTKNDTKFKEMMERYKESANFGVCYMRIVPIMKNYQPVRAKKMTIVSELDQICTSVNRKYWRYDLKSADKTLDYKILRNKSKISTLSNAIQADENRKAAIQELYIQHCMPAPLVVTMPVVQESEVVNETTI